MTRHESREQAFLLLFETNFGEGTLEERIENAVEAREASISDFARELCEGVLANREELDEKITGNTKNWNIDRISTVALTVLRLAVFEMLYREEIPYGVSINEAVEIAKLYGGEEDGSFANGVLGGLVRALPDKQAPAAGEPTA